ncbi:MAG: BcpO-related WXXGXW repeat protein [Gemmatimonadetes bacterium]|nr:BcpO-related WXXGXW repeat protein [Gemmatimonadota bacterium]
MKTLNAKTLRRTLTPTLLAAAVAVATLFVPASSAEAGARVRVVVKPRPVAKVVVKTPCPRAERVWVAGHWKRVSPRRSVWVPGHWVIR